MDRRRAPSTTLLVEKKNWSDQAMTWHITFFRSSYTYYIDYIYIYMSTNFLPSEFSWHFFAPTGCGSAAAQRPPPARGSRPASSCCYSALLLSAAQCRWHPRRHRLARTYTQRMASIAALTILLLGCSAWATAAVLPDEEATARRPHPPSAAAAMLAAGSLTGNWTANISQPKGVQHIEIWQSGTQLFLRTDTWGAHASTGSVDLQMMTAKVQMVGGASEVARIENDFSSLEFVAGTPKWNWCKFPHCPMPEPRWHPFPPALPPPPPLAVPPYPPMPCPFPQTWQLNQSTIIHTSNTSGWTDTAAASRYGVISFDWCVRAAAHYSNIRHSCVHLINGFLTVSLVELPGSPCARCAVVSSRNNNKALWLKANLSESICEATLLEQVRNIRYATDNSMRRKIS